MKTLRIVTAGALLLGGHTLRAQLPDAGAVCFSMGGNCTASARGYDAIAWNPANLGFSSNPAFSLNLLTLGGNTGLSPVKFNDIANFGGKLIPATVKEQWLQAIGSGHENGTINGGLNIAALSIGHFGFQVGLVTVGEANLNEDAAEALLFGNAGRTGTPRNFSFDGSNAEGSVFGTGAVSVGIPIMEGNHGEQLSVGVTGKWVQGIAAGRARDNGSAVTPDDVAVQFPSVFTDSAHYGNAGGGAGLDVGLAWSNGSSSFSATARNVINTFTWTPSAFSASLGTVSFNGANSVTHVGDTTYSLAPASLRAELENQRFKPEIAVGAARQIGSLLIAADASERIGDGIAIGPKMHIGGGFEYTGLAVLALRGGVAAITDGFQVAGGIGLQLGPYELSAGVSSRTQSGNNALGALISLVSIR